MAREGVVLTGWVILGLVLAPVAAQAGGRLAPPSSGFKAQPAFRPTSAFGSPGGFPFPVVRDRRGQMSRLDTRRVDRRPVFPAFPATGFLYAPLVSYAMSTDAPSPTVTVSPVTYVAPTVYVALPVTVPAPAPVAAPPAPPSTPSVVEYATGRYELRGDGASAPYTWVWIPNPPPVPPETPSATASPGSSGQIYRWTDDQGTEFWTNRLERIPEPYRSRAASRAQLAAQE
jgi:hypothetical protein